LSATYSMNKNIIALIAIVLFTFVCLRLAVAQLCDPRSNDSVATVVSSAISTPDPLHRFARPDPLSWEPILHRVLGFLSKVCVK